MPKCFLGHLEQKKNKKNVNGNFRISDPPTHPLLENSIIFFWNLPLVADSQCRCYAEEKRQDPTSTVCCLTWAFIGWQMAIYLSMVKAVNDRAEAFIARNWQNTIREQPTDPHTHMSPADNNDDNNNDD